MTITLYFLLNSVKNMFVIRLLSSYKKFFFVSLIVTLFQSPISLTNFLIGKTLLSNSFSHANNGSGISFNIG